MGWNATVPGHPLGEVSTRHSLELWYDGSVNAKATTLLSVILLAIGVSANGETGFDPKYERNDNIFNPTNQFRPDNPLNPVNQFVPNNPFNPTNEYNPINPLNPTDRFNPQTPFEPLH